MIDSNEKMVSYGMGWQFGRHLLTHVFDGLDLEAAFDGARDCFNGSESPYTDEQVAVAFKAIKERVDAEKRKAAANMAPLSEELLTENAARQEVTVTKSGLQFEVLEDGSGRRPGPLDMVRVHYHGALPTGLIFDSSVDRGTPAEFPVQDVIPGWTEALQMMREGSKYRLWIPSQLAYGETGRPPSIPGRSALVFDLELLAVV